MFAVAAKRTTWLSALVLVAVSVAECGLCCCVRAELRIPPADGVACGGCCSADSAARVGGPSDADCPCCWSLPPGNRTDVRFLNGAIPSWSVPATFVIVAVPPSVARTAGFGEHSAFGSGNQRQSMLCVWRN